MAISLGILTQHFQTKPHVSVEVSIYLIALLQRPQVSNVSRLQTSSTHLQCPNNLSMIFYPQFHSTQGTCHASTVGDIVRTLHLNPGLLKDQIRKRFGMIYQQATYRVHHLVSGVSFSANPCWWLSNPPTSKKYWRFFCVGKNMLPPFRIVSHSDTSHPHFQLLTLWHHGLTGSPLVFLPCSIPADGAVDPEITKCSPWESPEILRKGGVPGKTNIVLYTILYYYLFNSVDICH